MVDANHHENSPDHGDHRSTFDARDLLEQHGDALYRFAYRAVGNAAWAEDLVQTTLMAAIKSADGYDGRSSIRTWLIAILRRKIVDHIRKHARDEFVRSMSPDDLAELHEAAVAVVADTAPVHDHEEQMTRFRTRLRSCLEVLPPNLRYVFVLRDIERLEVAEVCDILGISATNLSTLLYRARLKLRACLEADRPERDATSE